MRLFIYIITSLITISLSAQELPLLLQKTKEKIEGVEIAEGTVKLRLDVDFINMPEKSAQLSYRKGQPLAYASENFIFIPKRGLDLSWSNLFAIDFLTVDRGLLEEEVKELQVYTIIPNDPKADFAIMTIKVDTTDFQIVSAEISTKNEGTFRLELSYATDQALPSQVIASFEMEKVRIPLNFMGSDTDIDRKAMKSDGQKTGLVYLDFTWSTIKP